MKSIALLVGERWRLHIHGAEEPNNPYGRQQHLDGAAICLRLGVQQIGHAKHDISNDEWTDPDCATVLIDIGSGYRSGQALGQHPPLNNRAQGAVARETNDENRTEEYFPLSSVAWREVGYCTSSNGTHLVLDS